MDTKLEKPHDRPLPSPGGGAAANHSLCNRFTARGDEPAPPPFSGEMHMTPPEMYGY